MVPDRELPSEAYTAGRWFLVVALTGIEATTLSLWLALVYGAAPFSRPAVVGVVVLVVGLQVQHFLTDLAVNGADVGFPLGQTLAVSVTEAALWTGWFAVGAALGGLRGVFVAGVAFAISLAVQHAAEVNALRDRPLTWRLLDPAAVGFSLLTALGASVWLALGTPVDGAGPVTSLIANAGIAPATVGAAALALALLVERTLVVRTARQRRDETRPVVRYRRGSGVRIR
ncbi:MAG: hypothetical protein ABEJ26_07420 [Halosimplex sp.]